MDSAPAHPPDLEEQMVKEFHFITVKFLRVEAPHQQGRLVPLRTLDPAQFSKITSLKKAFIITFLDDTEADKVLTPTAMKTLEDRGFTISTSPYMLAKCSVFMKRLDKLITNMAIQEITTSLEDLNTWAKIDNVVKIPNASSIYRNLLDSLRLWNERAQLDVIMNDNKHAERPPQHIYITCNFCKKGISAYIQAPGRPRNPYARFGTGSANKSKMQACPNCRKPLPRCSLCLVHMGTPSGWGSSIPKSSGGEDNAEGDSSTPTSDTAVRRRKLSNFTSWFTWCQTCRHGGHAHHLMEWFKEHTECPVTSCNCKCMSLDTVNKVASSSVSVMAK
nr:GATOR complex protein MIOS-like [Cherax quadricarinatus]